MKRYVYLLLLLSALLAGCELSAPILDAVDWDQLEPGTYVLEEPEVLPGIDVTVFVDDFSNTIHNYGAYVAYSNQFITKNPYHRVLYREDDERTNVLAWEVHKQKHTDHYAYAKFTVKLPDRRVGTILLRGTLDVSDAYLTFSQGQRFALIPAKKTTDFTSDSQTMMNEETQQFYDRLSTTDQQLWGIFAPFSIDDLEKQMSRRFDIAIDYKSIYSTHDSQHLHEMWTKGRVVEYTLQMMDNGVDPYSALYDLLNGRYDRNLEDLAHTFNTFDHPILFRLNNEMNGDWCHYSSAYASLDASLYRDTWIYVHDYLTAAGVDNIIWVWNPNDISYPDFQWNHSLNYYPGNQYVDIVGMTGYNTGNYYPGETWRTFDEIYSDLYQTYSQTFNRPFMITEFGSNVVGGQRDVWVNDMLEKITDYDRIKAVCWFSHIDYDHSGNPARIYDLTGDESVLSLFQSHFESEALAH